MRGGNDEWRVLEGFHCFNPTVSCQTRGLVLPVMEYRHEEGRGSIIGGSVYRGCAVPALRGAYVSSDFCSGEIFAFRQSGEGGRGAAPHGYLRRGFVFPRLGKTKKANSLWRITEAACIG